MTETELKTIDIDLKLKAKMMNTDDLYYTLQLSPSNPEWKYSESDAEYKLFDYKFKSEHIRQIVRNVLFKYKEMPVDSIKLGSKDFLFEVQVPKRVDKERMKMMFSQIGNEIKNEIIKCRTELDSFKRFVEDSEF